MSFELRYAGSSRKITHEAKQHSIVCFMKPAHVLLFPLSLYIPISRVKSRYILLGLILAIKTWLPSRPNKVSLSNYVLLVLLLSEYMNIYKKTLPSRASLHAGNVPKGLQI